MKMRLLACLIALILLTGCGENSAALRQYDVAFSQMANSYSIPSATAIVSKNSKELWSGKFGKNVGADSVFCIGSISKSFVAMLALILEQEGKLNFEDKVSKYLPNLDFWNKDNITIKNLLSMRSGIADYTKNFQTQDYCKEYTREELIKIGLSNSSFSKHGAFEYSNTNIIIISMILEKATGRSTGDLIKEKILKPAGLNNTFLPNEKEALGKRLVKGFSKTKVQNKHDFSQTTITWADLACGMYSTAGDMAKWGEAILHSPILSEASRKKLLDFLPVDDEQSYGLCIAKKNANVLNLIELCGNVPGYSACTCISGDTCVSVLCDLSDYSGSNLNYASEIAENMMASKSEHTKKY